MDSLKEFLQSCHERLEKATPIGEWKDAGDWYHDCNVGMRIAATDDKEDADCILIANAPTDLARLCAIVEVMREALERTQSLIAGTAMTNLPINVRELDGSIKQVRTKSCNGEAYDLIIQALQRADEIAGRE